MKPVLTLFAALLLALLLSVRSEADDLRGMYPIRLPRPGSLDMATRIDLKRSMEMAGDNLLANLDPTKDYLPNWEALPGKDGSVKVASSWHSHNLGRWWDAMLRLERATGYRVPTNAEAAMRENLQRFFDNPDHLCLEPLSAPDAQGPLDMHSLREGLLALHALVRYRDSGWAREKGHAMCQSLLRLTRDDGSWVLEQFAPQRRGGGNPAPDPTNHGRLIEALVWFYQATGDAEALRAADRFARYHLAYATTPDGAMGPRPGNHTHSYLGTLRGLLLFGELTDQRNYVDTVAATYERTVRALMKKSGFISHDLKQDRTGETTSPGDAAQLALWLAARHGRTKYFDDVERIVRARLIPCQITEVSGLKRAEDAPLLLGALGGMYKEPHGCKMATTDITAAVLHSLVDVYQHVATTDAAGLRINFHFDYEDQRVRIVSRREKLARVTILPKEKQNILVRIPRWTPRDSVSVTVGGKPYQPLIIGDYILVPRERFPEEIVVSYALPVSTQIEPTDGVDYAITWRGDEVMGIRPNSSHLPFYPDLAPTKQQ